MIAGGEGCVKGRRWGGRGLSLPGAEGLWQSAPMIGTSDLKVGVLIEYQGAPCRVETLKVSSPTARGGNTITRVRLRNLRTRQKLDVSFRGGETFPQPDYEMRPCQILYRESDAVHFMDQENYEQFALQLEDLEWEANFLTDELEGVKALRADGELLGIDLPAHVTLEITETPPAIKGASATARTKPATLETGHVVNVPEYIETGTKVKVDTRSGEYLGRATDG